ncbi:MAG: hypothetical protein ACI4L2_02820 [Wujia sp.]
MIIKCEKGKHYFDRDRFKDCPFCMEAEKIAGEKNRESLQSMDKNDTVSQTVTFIK